MENPDKLGQAVEKVKSAFVKYHIENKKENKVILSLFSKPDYEPRGYIITDKANLSEVLASLGKFYNVWNEADKLPF